jgi:hypothetical protein
MCSQTKFYAGNLLKIRDSDFLLALLLIVITAVFMTATYLRWINTSSFIGPLRFSHWLTIIGTSYIAIATSAFVLLKRFYPEKIKRYLRFHIFGNLLFFILISIHLAAQIGRPLTAYPPLGMGSAMYIAMTLEVISGFAERFPLIKQINTKTNKFIHASLVLVFYIVIGFHVLDVLGVI